LRRRKRRKFHPQKGKKMIERMFIVRPIKVGELS
jgi:hypothetical protein